MVTSLCFQARNRSSGISMIEIITAIAILAVGIWAVVTLFPRGQDIIRRSGLRQQAAQLAHEAISDYLADPTKMPFAIVPFDPNDDQIADRPTLLEPADLLTVRRTYNFVWGEVLDDGLPPSDPNKKIGLVKVSDSEWRAILRFAPARVFRVYRVVRYRRVLSNANLQDYEFYFDPTQPGTLYLSPVPRRRVLRVTYQPDPNSVVARELYIADSGVGQISLRVNAVNVSDVREEITLLPNEWRLIAPGVLAFNSLPTSLLCVDYRIDDPQLGNHWLVEIGATFDPDPLLRQRLGITPQAQGSVFQTTFGGFNSPPIVLSLMQPPPPSAFNLADPIIPLTDAQSGLLVFPNLPVGTRLRVAYRAGDVPDTPDDESWFVQVIKPPDIFQLFTQADPFVLAQFPFERLRWFRVNPNNPQQLQFDRLLAGLNVQVRYRNAANELFSEVHPIAGDGSLSLSQTPTRIEEVRGASLLVRVSGGSMWRQSPPKTKADYVELVTLVPPPFRASRP